MMYIRRYYQESDNREDDSRGRGRPGPAPAVHDRTGTAGYEVLEAPNGYEAIHLVDRRPPDLVVLDLLLPGFGGLGV